MEEANVAKVEAKSLTKTKATWWELSVDNIQNLVRIAAKIHPGLPESDEVFAERVKLFPKGCLALIEGDGNELCGYAISHPIRRREPPALNSLLGKIALDSDQYYIHDLAILPQFRGCGLAQECVKSLLAVASRFPTTCLLSVYGTAPFWERFGFLPVEIDEILKKKLLDYGDDAIYLERENKEHQRPTETNTGPL